eukprot:3372687-Amphidinium_carterae.2
MTYLALTDAQLFKEEPTRSNMGCNLLCVCVCMLDCPPHKGKTNLQLSTISTTAISTASPSITTTTSALFTSS